MSDKPKLRLGIWGLGRGSNFIESCRYLNIEIVAGCDTSEHMREKFHEMVPEAFLTADEDEFLQYDMDAVLIATFFTSHAAHSIKALDAGKHVLCEVTSFFTPAEGVALVEAVERSGKVYQLAENYPFRKDCLYFKRLWEQGIFGDLIYAEFDYLHECRSLCYTYIDDTPIEPGYWAHHWRSWLNAHYYCTHSLGPVMQITGRRPIKVCAPRTTPLIPGYIEGAGWGVTPELITMDNGALVRNLMGGASGDSHRMDIWGTHASARIAQSEIRLGGSGHGQVLKLNPRWDSMGEAAEKAGHGGGDFWELEFFRRAILENQPGPWDIYRSCDVTLTGIMAIRSQELDGAPVEIPDFRRKEVRDKFRNDHRSQQHFDPRAIFPADQDTAITGEFSRVMCETDALSLPDGLKGCILVRAAFDGMKLFDEIEGDADRYRVVALVQKVLAQLPHLADVYRRGRAIADAYPDSLGGRAMRDLLDNYYYDKIIDEETTSRELSAWLGTPRPTLER